MFENFTDSSRDDLAKDAIMTIRETLRGETLKSSICTIAMVGVGEPFHVLDQGTVQQIIDTFKIAGEQESPAAAIGQETVAEQGAAADQGQGGSTDEGMAPMES